MGSMDSMRSGRDPDVPAPPRIPAAEKEVEYCRMNSADDLRNQQQGSLCTAQSADALVASLNGLVAPPGCT